ncbi:MAG: hypothetical protein GWP19_00225 [Planctomycetia bacterium]|nr:hypothetical protein [Planctomycetia bacterium]
MDSLFLDIIKRALVIASVETIIGPAKTLEHKQKQLMLREYHELEDQIKQKRKNLNLKYPNLSQYLESLNK